MSAVTVTLFDDAPVYGGAERYLELLATGFDRRMVAPSVVLARDSELDALAERLARDKVPVFRLPRVDTLRSVGAFLSVFRHLAWHRSKILHFNLVDPRACNGAIVAAKLAGHSAIVATNQLPQSPFDALPTPKRHQLAMAVIKHHIVVSEASKADLAAHGVEEPNISVVRNCGADPGIVTASRRAAAREALGAGSNGPIVGFAGRLAAQKNPSLFLEVAARVAPARSDARFVLVGDGPERASLEELARTLGIGDRVRFLGQRSDAVDLYTGFDLLVFTSRYEGLPFTVLEAMWLGIPIVAARIPGIDEAIVDGRTGRLVDPAGPDEIAAAIVALLADDSLRSAMGHAARMRALEHFSLREMVDKTAAVYAKVLTRRASTAG